MERTGILALVTAVIACMLAASPAPAGDGQWSRFAASVPAGRVFLAPSPDRAMTIQVSGMTLNVLEGRRPVEGGEGIGLLLPAEIGWSPDSKAFFLTSSDGGPDGVWDAAVFLLEHGRLGYHGITGQAGERFSRDLPCAGPGMPHLGVLKFLEGSRQALLAAEAPAASSCGPGERVRGYVVEVPSGNVVRDMDQRRLMLDWGEALGPRFDGLLRPAGRGR